MRDKTEIREDGPRRCIEKSAYLLPPLLAVSCDNPSIILIPGERDEGIHNGPQWLGQHYELGSVTRLLPIPVRASGVGASFPADVKANRRPGVAPLGTDATAETRSISIG